MGPQGRVSPPATEAATISTWRRKLPRPTGEEGHRGRRKSTDEAREEWKCTGRVGNGKNLVNAEVR